MAIPNQSPYTGTKGSSTQNGAPQILKPNGCPARGVSRIAIIVPKRRKSFTDWSHAARKEGGYYQRYLEQEKATSQRRLEKVARRFRGHRQNNRSDLQRLAVVPAREYFRWQQHDSTFWDDPKNIKDFVRDNPETKPWEESQSRYVPGAREHLNR